MWYLRSYSPISEDQKKWEDGPELNRKFEFTQFWELFKNLHIKTFWYLTIKKFLYVKELSENLVNGHVFLIITQN